MTKGIINGKYIIFSDIQGNADYLRRFFEATKNMKNRGYICLGDIIDSGENYRNNFCIDLVREKTLYCVRGNHEDLAEMEGSKISTENKEYLKGLPNILNLKNIVLFHSSLKNPGSYLFNEEDIQNELGFINSMYPEARMAFFGHTHNKGVFVKKDNAAKDYSGLKLINPGGIGVRRGVEKTFAQVDFNNYSVRFFNLEEAERLGYLAEIVKSFDTTWMPALNKHSLGWFLEYIKRDAPHIQTAIPDNQNLVNIGKKLGNFDLTAYHKTKKSEKKKFIENYSLELAIELEKIAKEIEDTHNIRSPLDIRNEYLKLKIKRVK